MNKWKEIAQDFGMIRVGEVIARGFARVGFNNNAHKRHLWAIIVIENNKVKSNNKEKGLDILFSDDDYVKGFDRYHDNPMVIIATIHNCVVKRILVN